MFLDRIKYIQDDSVTNSYEIKAFRRKNRKKNKEKTIWALRKIQPGGKNSSITIERPRLSK